MNTVNVIKVGGAVVESEEYLKSFIESFSSIDGMKVLVHGGGRSATAVATALGYQTRMIEGRRVTDADMLNVVTMVYGGLVNKRIVGSLQAIGVKAMGLTGADMGCIIADRRPPVVLNNGESVDYGYVGDVKRVDIAPFVTLLESGVIPVISPLSFDGKGTLLNTNADTIASSVACALAQKYKVILTFCFEKAGVLADPDNDNSLIPTINRETFHNLIDNGTVSGGMLPKLNNAFSAIDSGVSQVRITNALNVYGGTVVYD